MWNCLANRKKSLSAFFIIRATTSVIKSKWKLWLPRAGWQFLSIFLIKILFPIAYLAFGNQLVLVDKFVLKFWKCHIIETKDEKLVGSGNSFSLTKCRILCSFSPREPDREQGVQLQASLQRDYIGKARGAVWGPGAAHLAVDGSQSGALSFVCCSSSSGVNVSRFGWDRLGVPFPVVSLGPPCFSVRHLHGWWDTAAVPMEKLQTERLLSSSARGPHETPKSISNC